MPVRRSPERIQPTPPPGEWAALATCAGLPPDGWDEGSDLGDRAVAVAICQRCPVTRDCSAYADLHRLVGVWGGTHRGVQYFRPRRGMGRPGVPPHP